MVLHSKARGVIAAAVLVVACGDPDGSATGSGAASDSGVATGSTEASSTAGGSASADGTGGNTTADNGTTDGTVGSGDAGTDSGGAAGRGAYVRLQYGGGLGAIGGFYSMLVEGGRSAAGPCVRQDSPDVGVVEQGGSITVRRGDEVLLVDDPFPSGGGGAVTLAVGDEVTLDAVPPEDLLSEFSLGPLVVPPTPLDAAAPETVAVGESFTITWTPPPGPFGDVLVEIRQDPTGANLVRCVAPLADGSLTVDGSLLTHLVVTDDENPIVAMPISAFATTSATVDGKTVVLEFITGISGLAAPVVAP